MLESYQDYFWGIFGNVRSANDWMMSITRRIQTDYPEWFPLCKIYKVEQKVRWKDFMMLIMVLSGF